MTDPEKSEEPEPVEADTGAVERGCALMILAAGVSIALILWVVGNATH